MKTSQMVEFSLLMGYNELATQLRYGNKGKTIWQNLSL